MDLPQVAFLDHVYAVVDADTAEQIARCDFLRGLGRFEMRTVVADGETWTGRYLLGRSTYVELFGPGDVEGPDEGEGSTGIGLSTRDRGGLVIVSERMKEQNSEGEVGRRTREEGDEHVPWFDYLSPTGSAQALSAWVMEYLADPTDRQRRESDYLEWTGQVEDNGAERQGPFVSEVCSVELGTTADDIAMVEPLLKAAGYVVTRSRDALLASDSETTIRLHSTTRTAAGLRRIEFALTARALDTHAEVIGRSRFTVGPGDRASWDFPST